MPSRAAWLLALCLAMPAAAADALAAAYDAAFVEQAVPASLELYVVAPVSVTMRNTGTATWQAGDVFLATTRPQDNYYWCIQDNRYGIRTGNRVVLPHDIAPGEAVRFDFEVKPLGCAFAAPSPLRFRMLSQAFGTFGEETPDPDARVTTAAEFVAQQLPATAPAAATVSATVTFRNTTTTAWTADAGFALMPAAGANAFGVTGVPMPGSVAPGASVRIPFQMAMPKDTGKYVAQWRVTRSGQPFGQASPATSVSVVAAGPANYQGLWWAAPAGKESGWGINFAHQEDAIFATWFTYDAGGSATWYSMTAQKTLSGSYIGNLIRSTGPAFSATPFQPALVRAVTVGTATLTFNDDGSGTFDYALQGVTQSRSITRQVFGHLPTCTFGLVNDLSVAYNYQDLWWAAPAGAEAGWGVNLAHQDDVIFATWFTYAPDGTPMWVSGTAPRGDDGSYSGTLVRTTGPPFSAQPFDPAKVTVTPAGTLKLTFTDGSRGTFAYTLDGVTQTKSITRQLFRTPGTICQ
jgi:hypothetical protein